VPTRLLHVSDLHVGTAEDSAVSAAFLALIEQHRPELLIASGDLTHRGRPDQHERAAELLRSFGTPVLAVPGNHDIPHTIPARFFRTFDAFERQWQTSQPVYRSDTLLVAGLNSVRPWRHQSGGLSRAQLRRARETLATAAPSALRAVAMHHQLIGAPWRTRKRPVSRRDAVLAALVDAGAELILSGHVHQAAVSERREFEVVGTDQRAVVVATTAGLGQPRPRRRGEARALNLCEVDNEALAISTYVWQGETWRLTAVRRFPRERRG
jgi:3',5'-cyclic AMP phosphodiesterase CpdA